MKEAKQLSRIADGIQELGDSPSVRNTGNMGARKQKLPLMANIILLFGSSEAKSRRAVQIRRSFPIVAFVGANGGGKSLALVATTLPTIAGVRWQCKNPAHLHTQAGVFSGFRQILSTVKILDPATGELSPYYVPFTDFSQLIEAEHCDILADEINGIASSREHARMDYRVANKLVQLRRCDVVLRWSAPNWARSDKIIREVTQAVVECSGFFPGASVSASGEFSSGGLWAPKRVFRFRTFDTAEFEEWSAGKRDKLDPVSSEWFRGVGSDAFRAYDTLDAVNAVAGMTPEDTCTVCEGRITRHVCKGHTPKKETLQRDFPAHEPAPDHEHDDYAARLPEPVSQFPESVIADLLATE
tara:strand:+ start:5109 stop:6179 length:1071 start_codon:yes stop_codon:yes gene_type:complete